MNEAAPLLFSDATFVARVTEQLLKWGQSEWTERITGTVAAAGADLLHELLSEPCGGLMCTSREQSRWSLPAVVPLQTSDFSPWLAAN